MYKCAKMPGRLRGTLLFILAIVSLHRIEVLATQQEAAVLTQLKEVWSTASNDVNEWVDAVDPCNGWPGIGCALQDKPSVHLPCFIANSTCKVVSLQLPNCSLSGKIPFILGGLSNLQTLDLHGNFLIGGLASQIFEGFPNLSYLDLSSNFLNGTIPQIGHPGLRSVVWAQNCFLADNRCHLDQGMRRLSDCTKVTSLQLQACPSWARNHIVQLYILLVVCPFTFIVLSSLVVIFFCWRRRTEKQAANLQYSAKIQSDECKHFMYEELEAATNNFHDNRILGCSGSGSVYLGRLDTGRYVAIKQLENGSSNGDIEFWNEVLIIGAIEHPNVVKLRGYCKEGRRCNCLLVYDYMPNGSVLDALLSNDGSQLPWERRYSIALGAASGLEYLHELCALAIIHRDIKPSNILLDSDFNARVGDFGLAKITLCDQSPVSTSVEANQGFEDPEYALTGKLTDKSDVFSFGMLLLVLISGSHIMETSLHPSGKTQLLSWMQVLAKAEELSELVDPQLKGLYNSHQVNLCAQIALLCTRILPDLRPSMGEVRRLLDGTTELPVAASLLNSPNSSSRGSFLSGSCTPPSTASFYGTESV